MLVHYHHFFLVSVYLGHSRLKYRVFVPHVTAKQLQAAEVGDYWQRAKKIFQLIFARELSERPDQVCCTHSEGKELLDQDLLKGIRCKCMYYIRILPFSICTFVHSSCTP